MLNRHYGKKVVQIVVPGQLHTPIEVQKRKAIFGGYTFQHFGHFLIEGLARLWLTRSYPDLPVVWCGVMTTAWQREIIDLLGVRNEPIFITTPTEFESLLIPEPGFTLLRDFKPEQAKFLSVVAPARVE